MDYYYHNNHHTGTTNVAARICLLSWELLYYYLFHWCRSPSHNNNTNRKKHTKTTVKTGRKNPFYVFLCESVRKSRAKRRQLLLCTWAAATHTLTQTAINMKWFSTNLTRWRDRIRIWSVSRTHSSTGDKVRVTPPQQQQNHKCQSNLQSSPVRRVAVVEVMLRWRKCHFWIKVFFRWG